MIDDPRDWLRILEMQYERAQARAQEDPLDREMLHWEIHGFGIALRHLLRVVMEYRAVDEVRQELAKFYRAVPDSKTFRDVLEHWDEYIDRRGNLQRRGEMSDKGFVMAYMLHPLRISFFRSVELTSNADTLHIAASAEATLDLRDALAASRRLVEVWAAYGDRSAR